MGGVVTVGIGKDPWFRTAIDFHPGVGIREKGEEKTKEGEEL